MADSLFSLHRGLGKDLVLLHGWGLNSGVWEPISATLQQEFKVTLIDLPGFGRNADNTPSPYTLEAITEQIANAIPDDSIVLGWSLGGLVAQLLACKYPTKVSHLITVASTPKFSQKDAWPGIQSKVLQAFETQLERDFSKTLDRFLAIQAMGSPSARQDIKSIKGFIEQYPIPSELALQSGLTILSDADLREDIATIEQPTLRMYGKLDSLVPKAAVSLISSQQPDADSHIFDHASHAPFISHPKDFLAVLLAWLGK